MATYSDLFDKLTLVDVDIHRWSGSVPLEPEDLGLPRTESVKKSLDLGRRRLVERAAVREIEADLALARGLVDRAGVKFPMISGSRAIPNVRVGVLIAELERVGDSLRGKVETFLAGLDGAYETMKPHIREAAKSCGLDPEATVEAAMRKAPTAASIRAQYGIGWRTFALSRPSGQEFQTSEDKDVSGLVQGLVAELRLEVREALDGLRRGTGAGLNLRSVVKASRALERAKEKNILNDPVLVEVIATMESVLRAVESLEPTDRAQAVAGVLGSIAPKLDAGIDGVMPDLLGGLGKRRMSAPTPGAA